MGLLAQLARWYWTFDRRLDRRTFWHLTLSYLLLCAAFSLVVGFAAGAVFAVSGANESTVDSVGDWVLYAYVLAVAPLQCSMTAARLHDTGRSGWTQVLLLIPVLGFIVLLFLVQPGSPETNKWGPPVLAAQPKETAVERE